jgi:uncharacterized protein YfdQ (DUF2303 family)
MGDGKGEMTMVDRVVRAFVGLLVEFLPPQQVVVEVGGKKTIVLRDGYRPHTIDTRKQAARAHKITNLDDMLTYAKRAADPKVAVLFCGRGTFVLVLDDVADTGRERVSYCPVLTQQAKDWLGSGVFKLSHIKLKKFIEDHEADLRQSNGLLAAVAQFSAKTEMTYAANLGKGGSKGIGFTIKTGQVEGAVELPPKFTIEIPIYEGWDQGYPFEVRLDWAQDDKEVAFTLEPANVQSTFEGIISEMVDHSKATLGDGWMVVKGDPRVEQNPGM